MLKPDTKATLQVETYVSDIDHRTGKRLEFRAGNKYKRIFWVASVVEEMRLKMKKTPVLVSQNAPPGPHWWWYKNIFYRTCETLTEEDVKVLVAEQEITKARKLAHANAVVASSKTTKKNMTRNGHFSDRSISPQVKQYVWQRDEGRCTRCGSKKNLEFDHIIPVSMGGSNTARNIQLLCEACNRSKGGNIV